MLIKICLFILQFSHLAVIYKNLLSFIDHGSSNLFHSNVDHRNSHLLPIDGHGPLNSPKRLSLDERLERELGIKVTFLLKLRRGSKCNCF